MVINDSLQKKIMKKIGEDIQLLNMNKMLIDVVLDSGTDF